MEANKEKVRLSIEEIMDQFHVSPKEHFDTYIEVKGKSASGQPVLANMTVILEVYA